MSLTTSDAQAEGTKDRSSSSVLNVRVKPVGRWSYGIDFIGVAALLFACAGLVGTLVLCRVQPGDSTTRDSAGARAVSVVPMRDQWYLDAPAPTSVPSLSEQPRDRWYLDNR